MKIGSYSLYGSGLYANGKLNAVYFAGWSKNIHKLGSLDNY